MSQPALAGELLDDRSTYHSPATHIDPEDPYRTGATSSATLIRGFLGLSFTVPVWGLVAALASTPLIFLVWWAATSHPEIMGSPLLPIVLVVVLLVGATIFVVLSSRSHAAYATNVPVRGRRIDPVALNAAPGPLMAAPPLPLPAPAHQNELRE